LKLIVHVFKKAGANFHVERNGITPFMLCSKYFKEIRLLKMIGFPSMDNQPFKLVETEEKGEDEKEYPEEKLLKYTNPITYFYVYNVLRDVKIKTQENLEKVIEKIKDLEGTKGAIFEKDILQLKKEKVVLEEKIDVEKLLVKVKERIDELKNIKSNEKIRRIELEIKRLKEEKRIIERKKGVQSRLREIRPDDFTPEQFWGVIPKEKEGELPHQYVRRYEVMEFEETRKSKLDDDEPRVSYREFRKQQPKGVEIIENKDSIWTGKLIKKVEKLNTVYFMFMFINDIKDLGYFWNQFVESFKGNIINIQKAVMDDNEEEFQTTCLHLLFSKRFMNSNPDDLTIIDIITRDVKCKGDEHKNINGVSPAMLYVRNYKPIFHEVDLYERIIIEKKKIFPNEEITKLEDEVEKKVLEIVDKYVPIVTETLKGIDDKNALDDSQKNTLLHYAGFGRNRLMHFILLKSFNLKRRKNKMFVPEIEDEGKVNFEPHYTF